MRRLLFALAVLTAALVVGSMIYFAPSTPHLEQVNAPRLLAAARTYADSLKAQGLPVPASVSLQELISLKLVTSSDVAGFAGLEVTISLTADGSRPQEVLVRVRIPDGHEIVALADGSVQQTSK
jgi:hypothetical protein